MSQVFKRQLSASVKSCARNKPLKFSDLKSIQLREPITPTHRNFDVSPDHPLWAFFGNGSNSEHAYRTSDELDTTSRAWTMPELRRKSFDDLHKLWYIILKERNVIATERRLANAIDNVGTTALSDLDAKMGLSHKRIKQVLLERQTAYERAQTLTSDINEYLANFEQRYINAAEDEIASENDKLVRLQYAVFGIQPALEDYNLESDINQKFVEGISFIAKVKLGRHLAQNPNSSVQFPLNGVVEELPFLIRSVDQAVEEVSALRESGQSVLLDKIDVFPFVRNALGKVLEEFNQQSS
ncbi:54S ribosomal protein L4 mitochondrial [Yamadazyma tenuis]|uniref:Large ribosomal subunit protein uL29m n=1 Tax=Candida tenuis (strain ATCC 10573 / BCRC 21748 / CBS 615 / JCM 9827 / NBRC 10315 / NRRL Y-1498 / VKM Y-70) TaxID=590646 RepID=G3B522_CANTC|nr:MRP-L47-domain-containing protein [Yamadazyma tenuis ATCC 10573]XP_006687340.1 uncharacterized protein CANTEDRAFT_114430 [Yamadazyma tenuis ATCC 10573]EGV63546.1 MRP-L47-domain-containing protein [Yamadazyma tenuis ATCC 10573]EGV63547.1 hypothetical protein CANTEDRAFT_114430 [Yamadazyma tenuis ATCC 10573]WEJ97067.1 54S ribosomal protein L4 mitochondrial [Yamadazyma tenuis]